MIRQTLIAASAALATAGFAFAAVAKKAEPSSAMWFSDSYATAYYQLDPSNHEVVTSVVPGPKGGNAMTTRITLDDGESTSATLNGHGQNTISVTLTITRDGDNLKPVVTTQSARSAYIN